MQSAKLKARLLRAREEIPTEPGWLWDRIRKYHGIRVQDQAVCCGHSSPFDMLSEQFLIRPRIALWHGPRGGGKSFLSALDTHLASRFYAGHGTRILGGSKDQSKQIYQALRHIVQFAKGPYGNDRDQVARRQLLAQSATYRNGSEVSILAASMHNVRGPHVASLKLDEVDEIAPEVREAAIGMAMEKVGPDGKRQKVSILMTSTWHRPEGPMSQLIKRAEEGAFPKHTFCTFEVLERCPEGRSGRWIGGEERYENCPECPIRPWCHEDWRDHPTTLPKAKRSDGHYSIDTFIQKAEAVSPGTFEADYLCRGPQPDGLFFPEFSDANVTSAAEYRPNLPVHVGVDSGHQTGGVFFQIEERQRDGVIAQRVVIFADYFSKGVGAYNAAVEIQEVARQRCNGLMHYPTTDPAGKASTAVGPITLGEYSRAGFKPEPWPVYPGSVKQSIELVQSFVKTATGRIDLIINPRCEKLIAAFKNYSRKKVRGSFTDQPADPQHPHEDMIDALRGALHAAFIEGRRKPPQFTRVPARNVF